MQNLPELITGSSNFIWASASLLAFIIFGKAVIRNEVAGDVRRLILGIMALCFATMLDRFWWTGFRFFLYRGEADRAQFFMEWAHLSVAASAAFGLIAYYLHIYPNLQTHRYGRALYWVGALVFLVGYAAIIH